MPCTVGASSAGMAAVCLMWNSGHAMKMHKCHGIVPDVSFVPDTANPTVGTVQYLCVQL